MAHHVRACGGSFCRGFCKTTAPSAVASDRASGPGLRAPTRTPRTRRGAECMKIGAAVFVHLCCRTRRAAMEGGSEKGGKVSCASPPPRHGKGETSQPKGGKTEGPNRTVHRARRPRRGRRWAASATAASGGGASCIFKVGRFERGVGCISCFRPSPPCTVPGKELRRWSRARTHAVSGMWERGAPPERSHETDKDTARLSHKLQTKPSAILQQLNDGEHG